MPEHGDDDLSRSPYLPIVRDEVGSLVQRGPRAGEPVLPRGMNAATLALHGRARLIVGICQCIQGHVCTHRLRAARKDRHSHDTAESGPEPAPRVTLTKRERELAANQRKREKYAARIMRDLGEPPRPYRHTSSRVAGGGEGGT